MAQTQNAGAAVAAGHVGGKVIAGIQIDFGADCSAKLAVGMTKQAEKTCSSGFFLEFTGSSAYYGLLH